MKTESERMAGYAECVRFHGHSCPGLAYGYRAALAGMEALGVGRPEDEELVAVAETKACGVDAVQVVTGCTAGKGNLVLRDHGKHVFTFSCRKSKKAVRVLVLRQEGPEHEEMGRLRSRVFDGSANEAEQARFRELRERAIRRLLELPQEEVLRIAPVPFEPPAPARIYANVLCDRCGEPVAEPMTREEPGGRRLCIPCHAAESPGA